MAERNRPARHSVAFEPLVESVADTQSGLTLGSLLHLLPVSPDSEPRSRWF